MRIAIVGLGLIGGSLGKAFKMQRKIPVHITGVDRDPDTIAAALRLEIIDAGCSDLEQAVATADVVFFCTPVLTIAPLMKKAAKAAKPGAIFTDAGSTKGNILSAVRGGLPGHIAYVGGHPMAGAEKSGVMAATGTLFEGKTYIFTPETTTNQGALETVKALIATTGAVITEMAVQEHDHYAAMISHVPHVAAAGLVSLLLDCQENPAHRKLIGGGFRDTTRIASSDADMWSDICLANGAEVTAQLGRLQLICQDVAAAIERGDREFLHHYFFAAKELRDHLISVAETPNGR